MTNSGDAQPRSPSHFRASVGARISALRKDAGLLQRELAAFAGLRPDRLNKYEAGQQPPPLFALSKMALALGRPVDLFLPELALRDEGDRLFYGQVRRAWAYPSRSQVRQALGQLLQAVCDFYDKQGTLDGAPLAREARHAASRR